MLNLRTKLLMGFSGLLTLLVTVSLLSIVVITWYSKAIDKILAENYNSVVFGQNMLEALDQLTDDSQDLLFGGRARDKSFNDQIDLSKKQFDDNLNLEHGNITLPGEGDAEASLREQWIKYRDLFDKVSQASLPTSMPNSSTADIPIGYRRLLMQRDQVKAGAQAIVQMNLINMKTVNGHAKDWARYARTALYTLLGAGLLLGSILIALVGRWILQPLRTLTRSVREIEAGNLNLVVQVRTKDELGVLAEAFNSMTAKLRAFRETDQAKLLRTQQTTQLAIDSLPDAVAVINVDGVLELTNGTALRLFSLRPQTTVHDIKYEWLTTVFQAVRDQLRPFEPQGYQNALQIFDNGTERFFLPQGIPIKDPTGRLVGVTLVLIDVTRLRQIDEVKSSLVSTVSHELRTPLTSIRLANHLLLSDRIGALSPKQTEVVMESRDNADRLQKIIENLLDMSRIESGRSQLELAAVKPYELANEAADQLRAAVHEKGVDLSVNVPVELPAVHADRARVNHVLLNLLHNALRYTAAGGSITLSATAGPALVTFIVHDTGQGIPKMYQNRIFERFFRVPGQNATGVGLGLAIAREIVHAHGGTINVESHERSSAASDTGGGTVFRFTLPRENPEKEQPR